MVVILFEINSMSYPQLAAVDAIMVRFNILRLIRPIYYPASTMALYYRPEIIKRFCIITSWQAMLLHHRTLVYVECNMPVSHIMSYFKLLFIYLFISNIYVKYVSVCKNGHVGAPWDCYLHCSHSSPLLIFIEKLDIRISRHVDFRVRQSCL